MNTVTTPLEPLKDAEQALDALREGRITVAGFVEASRSISTVLPGLPPAFGEVWFNLMNRLESGALFTEESCSFSQRDLHQNLQTWLDTARARLQSAA